MRASTYLAEAAIVGHLDVLGAAVAANRLEPIAFGEQHIPQLVQVLERLETQLGRLPSAACEGNVRGAQQVLNT